MTIEEFKEKFREIKKLGFVPSLRRGPTGIGHTLESLLGISENNIALSDIIEAELKAHRINSTSMITLFTFNKKVWKMPPLEAIRKYGTRDVNGRLGLYSTMSQTPTSTGLFLQSNTETIQIRHTGGRLIAEWNLSDLVQQCTRKIPALLLVSAFVEIRGDHEYFHFTTARLLKGTTEDIIREQILSGNIRVDLRLHDKGTSARNHGTGFRILEDKLPYLFKENTEIE